MISFEDRWARVNLFRIKKRVQINNNLNLKNLGAVTRRCRLSSGVPFVWWSAVGSSLKPRLHGAHQWPLGVSLVVWSSSSSTLLLSIFLVLFLSPCHRSQASSGLTTQSFSLFSFTSSLISHSWHQHHKHRHSQNSVIVSIEDHSSAEYQWVL